MVNIKKSFDLFDISSI